MSYPNSRLAGIAVVSMILVSTCFAKSTEAIGRECENGQAKACDDLKKIVTTAKNPRDRLTAIPFISDNSVLSTVANDGTQTREVIAAATARLEELNRQAKVREDEQKKQAQINEEAQRGIAPNAEEIQVQVAKLNSYKIGVTTLGDFYTDKWNAKDPVLTNLGIVGSRYDKPSATVEFVIAYYGNYDKHADAKAAVAAAARMQDSFEMTRRMAEATPVAEFGPLPGASAWTSSMSSNTYADHPVFSDLHGVPLTVVDTHYPEYHVKFVSGRLASITKK